MRCPTLKDLPPSPRGKTGWPWKEESPQLFEKMPDSNPWPKISIVTPKYNYGKFIAEAIRSILLQGCPNLGCILKSLVFGYSVMYDTRYYFWQD